MTKMKGRRNDPLTRRWADKTEMNPDLMATLLKLFPSVLSQIVILQIGFKQLVLYLNKM
jgi:hypothetical protein